MSTPSSVAKRVPQPNFQNDKLDHVSRKWWLPEPPELKLSDPGYLCHVCRHIDFRYLVFKSEFAQVLEEIPLDKLSLVLQRQQCAFCRLVKQTVEHFYGAEDVALFSEDDTLIASMIATFRSPGTFNTEPWQFKIWVKPTPRGTDPNPSLLIHHVEDEKWVEAGEASRGVLLSTQAKILKAKVWMLRCAQGFGLCATQKQKDEEIVFPKGFRLVDVKDRCVVVADGSYKYFTLSYVWGGATCLRITKQDEHLFATKGSLTRHAAEIPQTILDAMDLTAKLEERYLWVDSLCILQNDLEAFRSQIAAMRTIYSQSALTIAAVHGTNANAGLPGVRTGRKVRSTIERIQGIGLAPRPRVFEDVVNESTWNTRAWTYQERLLSPRVLFLTEEQMFFKCEHYDDPRSEDTASWGTKRFKGPSPTSDGGNDILPREHSVNTVSYKQVVEAYTKRNFTYAEDVLDAFAGASGHFEQLFRGDLLYGLPQTELVFALLWRPHGPFSRRTASNTDTPIFPSWSWAGWSGQVEYNCNDTLARVKFVCENGEVVTCDELRQPRVKNRAIINEPWWDKVWTRNTESRTPWTYCYENAGDQKVWFAHPIALVERRSPIPNLIVSTDHQTKPLLRFWAETNDLPVSSDYTPPDNIAGPLWYFPLSSKDGSPDVGGYIWLPSHFLKDLGQKKLDLVRLARTRSSVEPKDNDWQKTLRLDTERANHAKPDGLSHLEDLKDEQAVSHARDFFPDRPVFDTTKYGIDQQRFDCQKPFCLYQLLLVEWLDTGVAERIGHGTVHIDFWAREKPVVKLVALA